MMYPESKNSERTAHLDEEQAILYLAGAISPGQRESIVNHLSDCDECRTWVAGLVKGTPPGQASPPDPGYEHQVVGLYSHTFQAFFE